MQKQRCRERQVARAAFLMLILADSSNAFQSSPSISRDRTGSLFAHYQASSSIFYRNEAAAAEEVLTVTDSQISSPQTTVQQTSSDIEISGVSMPLVRSIWYNQASILLFATSVVAGMSMILGGNFAFDVSSLHWSSGENFHSLFDWNMTPLRVLQGVLATLPLIALGNVVENSADRDASRVNFATTNMVISLFGRRKSQLDPDATSSMLVMALSLAIALSTGLSEEMIFRGYTPVALASFSHSILFALIGQAALFAFAHISPKSSTGENKVVGGLQFLNGLWYGLVYLWTGGDILPCIVAHMLYDMHVLCETWTVINHQMDYTQEAYQNTLCEEEEMAIQQIQKQAGPSLNRDTLNFARRFFFAFDYEHKGSLSLHDVQRAVSYAFLNDKVTPEPETVENTFNEVIENRVLSISSAPANRLVVSEFLRLLFALKSNRPPIAQ